MRLRRRGQFGFEGALRKRAPAPSEEREREIEREREREREREPEARNSWQLGERRRTGWGPDGFMRVHRPRLCARMKQDFVHFLRQP